MPEQPQNLQAISAENHSLMPASDMPSEIRLPTGRELQNDPAARRELILRTLPAGVGEDLAEAADTRERRLTPLHYLGCLAALALACCAQSRLLLLDEPLQGLDAQYAAVLRQAISEQKLEKSVVLVTHDEALASDVADQRILL